MQHICCIG
jgi:hypothetical protein